MNSTEAATLRPASSRGFSLVKCGRVSEKSDDANFLHLDQDSVFDSDRATDDPVQLPTVCTCPAILTSTTEWRSSPVRRAASVSPWPRPWQRLARPSYSMAETQTR